MTPSTVQEVTCTYVCMHLCVHSSLRRGTKEHDENKMYFCQSLADWFEWHVKAHAGTGLS